MGLEVLVQRKCFIGVMNFYLSFSEVVYVIKQFIYFFSGKYRIFKIWNSF